MLQYWGAAEVCQLIQELAPKVSFVPCRQSPFCGQLGGQCEGNVGNTACTMSAGGKKGQRKKQTIKTGTHAPTWTATLKSQLWVPWTAPMTRPHPRTKLTIERTSIYRFDNWLWNCFVKHISGGKCGIPFCAFFSHWPLNTLSFRFLVLFSCTYLWTCLSRHNCHRDINESVSEKKRSLSTLFYSKTWKFCNKNFVRVYGFASIKSKSRLTSGLCWIFSLRPYVVIKRSYD